MAAAKPILVYNLVLAWIPLGLSVVLHALDGVRPRASARVASVLCLAAWLAFFPNAPYLMTDLLHLKVQGNLLVWLDLIALQAFAWTGLALGFVSLDLVQRVVARRVGRVASWLFAAAVMGLSAFGIYLGRFRRWNTWDVARSPPRPLTLHFAPWGRGPCPYGRVGRAEPHLSPVPERVTCARKERAIAWEFAT